MAILRKGLFGPFTGKIGGVVGSTWNGIQVVKKLPGRRKTAPTKKQVEQQARFTLLMNFFKPLSPLLNEAVDHSKLKMSGFNKVVSDNKNVVTGTYPDFKIDYPNVMLGKNIIRNAEAVTVTAKPEGKLNFALNRNSLYSARQFWVPFFVAACEEESQRWVYKINPGLSVDQTCELDLGLFSSKSVHVYFGFKPSNRKYTNSFYAGLVAVL